MTAHAAALAEQILTFIERRADIAHHQNHVGGVTRLAASFHVFFRKQRPEPMLVGPMGFLDAGGRPAIALVARRAAKLFRIMYLQEFRLAMRGEGPSVVVRFLALHRHGSRGQLHWLANSQVAGL